jgi:hypothetical protein
LFEGMGAGGAVVKVKLSELFAPGEDSRVIYNFMFPPMPQDEGRPGQQLLPVGPKGSRVTAGITLVRERFSVPVRGSKVSQENDLLSSCRADRDAGRE